MRNLLADTWPFEPNLHHQHFGHHIEEQGVAVDGAANACAGPNGCFQGSSGGATFFGLAGRSLGQNYTEDAAVIGSREPYGEGYNESFNGKLREELVNGEVFYTLQEAQIVIEPGSDRRARRRGEAENMLCNIRWLQGFGRMKREAGQDGCAGHG